MAEIGLIGAGSWGLALSRRLSLNGHDVTVWVFEQDEFEELKETNGSQDYLPGITLPEAITYTNSLDELQGMSELLLAVPSHAMRTVVSQMAGLAFAPQLIINVAKGIENDTRLRMSQVISQELESVTSQDIVTVSGPSHAEEVSRDIPTAVVAASDSLKAAERAQQLLMDKTFRVYTNNDIIGAELGGSVKNVIAIAAGILDGMEFGDNPKAALMTRGITEITRLGLAAGAKEQTFSGLSGIGDLIVTCLSQHSRNRHVGEEIGKGNKLDDIIGKMKMVAEGVKTTKSVHQMAAELNVEMPISEEVHNVLFHDKDPHQAITDLMTREPVHERHSMQ
ncbi:MAG: NAD(P)H-dependent glycerol-3-phosphate dehydrogenase [Candidatus Marinimicrobia bacterium]|nr:NAD(P)H-dependent glycerol-3-phosphate dehydrogenase [Candidatus Neomarinimicrobiota bacterium]MCF7828257.1 NAD(P)H-dependent glycerol-3-phosphate dehydrogenase [Candidatus Neomarinimicrobiota bacterium]MCF7879568.1 NAD(P)H-dependent glycerol-3-phosphate dehydrogenase [Candidatus Neomarinimicrobiota bacterium]